MPVAGLPKVLENTMTSILDTHDIRSWSIFAESNGEISLRIKFNMADIQSGDIQGTYHTVAYKKKGQKQIVRDKNRLAKRRSVWNSNNSDSSMEIVRAETNPQSEDNLTCCTPPVIHEEASTCSISGDFDKPHILDLDRSVESTCELNIAIDNKSTLRPEGIEETEVAAAMNCSVDFETLDEDIPDGTNFEDSHGGFSCEDSDSESVNFDEIPPWISFEDAQKLKIELENSTGLG